MHETTKQVTKHQGPMPRDQGPGTSLPPKKKKGPAKQKRSPRYFFQLSLKIVLILPSTTFFVDPMVGGIPAHPGASRHIPANRGASRRIPAHPCKSRRIQAHPGASRHIPANPGASRCIPAQPGASRHIPANPGASQRIPAHPGTSLQIPAHPGASRHIPAHPGTSLWVSFSHRPPVTISAQSQTLCPPYILQYACSTIHAAAAFIAARLLPTAAADICCTMTTPGWTSLHADTAFFAEGLPTAAAITPAASIVDTRGGHRPMMGIQLCNLIVGHTHDKVDRFFSRIRAILKGIDYFTWGQVQELVIERKPLSR
jgi:hypothetical protein